MNTRELLRKFFEKFYPDFNPGDAFARFEFKLRKVREYWGTKTYEFIVSLKGDYRKLPTKGIKSEDLKPRSGFVYRGMSYEEWNNSKKTGFLGSNFSYTFSNQVGLTFFGSSPDTALFYSSGYQPLPRRASKARPGVVIELSKDWAPIDHTDSKKRLTHGEHAFEGKVPINMVSRAWYAVPYSPSDGYLEVIVRNDGRMEEGSRTTPSSNMAYVPIDLSMFESLLEEVLR